MKSNRGQRQGSRKIVNILLCLALLTCFWLILSTRSASTPSGEVLSLPNEKDNLREKAFIPRYNLTADSSFVFIHISKTGGTKMDDLLGKEGLGNHRHADCLVPKSSYYRPTFWNGNTLDWPTCKIVSAEVDMWTLSQWIGEGRKKHFGTLLREPFSRLCSQFDHNKNFEASKLESCNTLADFWHPSSKCVEALSGKPGNILQKYDNWQVKNVGNATHLMQNFTFFGLTEQYHASLCLLWFTFMDDKRFDEHCRKPEKVSAMNKKRPGTAKSEEWRDDPALHRLAREVNKGDFELYEWAKEEFERRVKTMEALTGLTESLLV